MARQQTTIRHSGFTLIELLLVMVILVVLATVVATRFSGTTEKAKFAAAKTNLKSMETALDAFKASNDRYPTNEEGLQALIDRPTDAKAPASEWPYLKADAVPLDPWGKPFIYRNPAQSSKGDYDLLSGGPDGAEGGTDDISSWQ